MSHQICTFIYIEIRATFPDARTSRPPPSTLAGDFIVCGLPSARRPAHGANRRVRNSCHATAVIRSGSASTLWAWPLPGTARCRDAVGPGELVWSVGEGFLLIYAGNNNPISGIVCLRRRRKGALPGLRLGRWLWRSLCRKNPAVRRAQENSLASWLESFSSVPALGVSTPLNCCHEMKCRPESCL